MRTLLAVLALSLPVLGTMLLAQLHGRPSPVAASAPLGRAADVGSGGCWHVVGQDDSLRSIARRYYGSGRLWRTLQVANDVGLHPRPGSRLWVPGHLPELP